MSQYEFTFLMNEETELSALEQTAKDSGIKIISRDKWGKKTLAFPIKKNPSAVFYQWVLETDGKNVKPFKQKLNFNDKILRYLLLVKD